jgi:hypothetical protein
VTRLLRIIHEVQLLSNAEASGSTTGDMKLLLCRYIPEPY